MTKKLPLRERLCEWCGEPFISSRADARYCPRQPLPGRRPQGTETRVGRCGTGSDAEDEHLLRPRRPLGGRSQTSWPLPVRVGRARVRVQAHQACDGEEESREDRRADRRTTAGPAGSRTEVSQGTHTTGGMTRQEDDLLDPPRRQPRHPNGSVTVTTHVDQLPSAAPPGPCTAAALGLRLLLVNPLGEDSRPHAVVPSWVSFHHG